MSTKKKIKLEKETLMSLQEDQMKSLIGAADKTTDSGVACDNDVDLEVLKNAGNQKVENSCCRRSCN